MDGLSIKYIHTMNDDNMNPVTPVEMTEEEIAAKKAMQEGAEASMESAPEAAPEEPAAM